MNSITKHASNLLLRSTVMSPSHGVNSVSQGDAQLLLPCQNLIQQQYRGIRVKVNNGNLGQALSFMRRKMVSSGIERLISKVPEHHIKNSEKRVLAKKRLELRVQSENLSRKLKVILANKVRDMRENLWNTLVARCTF